MVGTKKRCLSKCKAHTFIINDADIDCTQDGTILEAPM